MYSNAQLFDYIFIQFNALLLYHYTVNIITGCMVILVTIHGVQEKNFRQLVGRLSGYGTFFSGTPGILSSYSTFDASKLANHCFGGHLMCI